jgi:hypothetical protein
MSEERDLTLMTDQEMIMGLSLDDLLSLYRNLANAPKFNPKADVADICRAILHRVGDLIAEGQVPSPQ